MRVDRVLAPNPGPFTGPGTNTYVVGDDADVTVIDPGPVIDSHAGAIVRGVGSRRIVSVIVTHTHPDHAPLANPLAREFGVPALGYAPGPDFEPDGVLDDGSTVTVGRDVLTVVYTPGHADDHICLRSGDVLFTGDHILGGTSVMVEDVGAYMRSLERVSRMDLSRMYPGHGHVVDRPREVVSWYIAHRRQREAEILDALRAGAATVGEIVDDVYAEVDPSLHPLAARSVAAHLRKLADEGLVRFDDGGSQKVEMLA